MNRVKSCNYKPQADYFIHKELIWRNVCSKYENDVKWNTILLFSLRHGTEFTYWTSNLQPIRCIFHNNILAYKATALV